ncbi:hypothetical protein BH23GEM4_BH23GEM4_25350 [soil metagenome]
MIHGEWRCVAEQVETAREEILGIGQEGLIVRIARARMRG